MFSKLLTSLRVGIGRTENGAITNESSSNHCLDLFFIAGASRNIPETEIVRLFSLALSEDQHTTLKILFWARDIRGGAGERRFFRYCWNYLVKLHPDIIVHLIEYVPVYGRWDDLFETLYYPEILEQVCTALRNGDSLACKWAPRKGPIAELLTKGLKLSPKQYRRLIVANTKVVETQMCNNKWGEIEYKKIPSGAMNKYIKAWKRHDETRFIEYIEAVKGGTETMNASALFPYQVYENYKSGEVSVAEAQWKNLPDYGGHGSILPVIDVSGSMSGRPMSISISLGVYLSEKIKGPFQNAIISFEGKPKLHELKGNIVDRFIQCERSADDMSTNLQGVFDLLLSVAIRDRIAQADMPDKLLIISDMEFNNCNNISNFELIESRYRSSGYKMPYIVFWNVNGRSGNVPVTSMQYAGLISGTSPSIIQGILEDSINTPIDLMKKTLDSERYSVI